MRRSSVNMRQNRGGLRDVESENESEEEEMSLLHSVAVGGS